MAWIEHIKSKHCRNVESEREERRDGGQESKNIWLLYFRPKTNPIQEKNVSSSLTPLPPLPPYSPPSTPLYPASLSLGIEEGGWRGGGSAYFSAVHFLFYDLVVTAKTITYCLSLRGGDEVSIWYILKLFGSR